jgi:hypothetical protein
MDQLLATRRQETTSQSRSIEGAICDHLMEKYGPLLDSGALAQVLKFPTVGAFDRALRRGHVGIQVHTLPHRPGVFSLATEVAQFLADIQVQPSSNEVGQTETQEKRVKMPRMGS